MATQTTNIDILNAYGAISDANANFLIEGGAPVDTLNYNDAVENILSDENNVNDFLNTILNKTAYSKTVVLSMFKNKLDVLFTEPLNYGDGWELKAVKKMAREDYYNTKNSHGKKSNMLEVVTPEVVEHVMNKRYDGRHPISLDQATISQAFFNVKNGLSSLIAEILATHKQSYALDIYDYIVNKLVNAPADEFKEIECPLITGLYDKENASKLNEFIINLVSDMTLPNTEYSKEGIRQIQDNQKLLIFMNKDIMNSIDVNVLTSQFNQRKFDIEFIHIPIEGGYSAPIFIMDKQKMEFKKRLFKLTSTYLPDLDTFNYYILSKVRWGYNPFVNAVKLQPTAPTP